jgi:hypothetical protein
VDLSAAAPLAIGARTIFPLVMIALIILLIVVLSVRGNRRRR